MSENQEPPPTKRISISQRLFPNEPFSQDRDAKMNTFGLAILATLIAYSMSITNTDTQTKYPPRDKQTENSKPNKLPENNRLIKLREAA